MKVTIVGNLGADADIKYTANGKAVANFNVAETIGWGENKRTQWLKCILWGDRAEKIAPHLLKGTKVVVFGEGEMVEWEAKDGQKRKSFECNVSDLKFVGGKKGEAGERPKESRAPSAESPEPQGEISFDDDDIPF